MDEQQIARINALARLSRQRPLTQSERAEQTALRAAYVAAVRRSLTAQLDGIRIAEPDGSVRSLRCRQDADGKDD